MVEGVYGAFLTETLRKLLLQLIVHVPYYLLLTTSTETLRKLLLQLIVHVAYYLLLTTSTEEFTERFG
jgi:heme/copper-type cytochrome/quinol oxidase subunit 4